MKLSPAMGKRKYLAGPAEQFSATRQFPPQGHQSYEGSIKGGKLTIKGEEKTHVLQKTIRKSPTLGKKPPKGAIILFDGSNKKEWQGGRLDESTKLLNTDGKDIRSVRKFSNYTLHLEFMLPYRPAAWTRTIVTADYTISICMRTRSSILLDWREQTMNVEAFTPSKILI